MPFVIRQESGQLRLLLAGKVLGFPMLCAKALGQLQAGPVSVAALDPSLSENNRTVLLSALIREGLVTILDGEPA